MEWGVIAVTLIEVVEHIMHIQWNIGVWNITCIFQREWGWDQVIIKGWLYEFTPMNDSSYIALHGMFSLPLASYKYLIAIERGIQVILDVELLQD